VYINFVITVIIQCCLQDTMFMYAVRDVNETRGS